MSNIVGLNPSAPANEDLVKQLERFLEMARAGDIVGIAYALARRDHARLTGWVNPPLGYGHDQAAAIMELHHRYGRMLTDGVECEDL